MNPKALKERNILKTITFLTHQFNYQQIVPTLRDIVYSFYDENPQNIPHKKWWIQGIQKKKKKRISNRNGTLNTPFVWLRLIEDLQTLENSIVDLVNQYNTNTNTNTNIDKLYAHFTHISNIWCKQVFKFIKSEVNGNKL
jgi:hypothetical protein